MNELGTPTKIFTKEMEAYGFSDYMGVGGIIAHERGGYLHDGIISVMREYNVKPGQKTMHRRTISPAHGSARWRPRRSTAALQGLTGDSLS